MKKTQKQITSKPRMVEIKLSTYDPKQRIEQFFRDLSPAGKIAVKLYEAISTAQMEFSETGTLDKLSDVIDGHVNNIKTSDEELLWLLGTAQFMELTREKNSITIKN